MIYTPSRRMRFFPAILAAAFLVLSPTAAQASVMYFPGVTEDMTGEDYWAGEEADALLLDFAGIQARNRQMLDDPACTMNDLENDRLHKSWDLSRISSADNPGAVLGDSMYREILSAYGKGGYYDRSGNPIDTAFAESVQAALAGADPASFRSRRYGIAVHRTDLRAYPTDAIITDDPGDMDFDYVQLSGVAVGEPVIIQGASAGGEWLYCATDNCGGWIKASDIAICQSRSEWLSAWKFPASRSLVVTESRFALEYSNTEPALSGLVLTMGTVLERADEDGPTGSRTSGLIANRSAYQNHVVWIPTRSEDGSLRRVKALISERHEVHEGYLPMTRRNILHTAMNALGDAYGWGGMLSAEDCSGYTRGIYACFGMKLPRNTTWQAATPLFRYDLNYLPDDHKREVIGSLPAGSLLYFNGHAMLYLGEKDGEPYVLSSISSTMNPNGSGKLRVRSVVINNLSLKRANGSTMLQSLHTAVVPWRDPGAPGAGFRQFPDGTRFRRDNGSFVSDNWQEADGSWYYFNRDGLMAANTWIPSRTEEGVWYYLGPDGKMARDTVIDEQWYVDTDGKWKE